MAYVIRVLKEVTGKNMLPPGKYYYQREQLEEREDGTYAHLVVTPFLADAARFPTQGAALEERNRTILSAYDCATVPEEAPEVPTDLLALLETALTRARDPTG